MPTIIFYAIKLVQNPRNFVGFTQISYSNFTWMHMKGEFNPSPSPAFMIINFSLFSPVGCSKTSCECCPY